jgi:hypothetical protein
MTFLNPAILLGLLAASIPFVIHLLNLRRRKKIDFGSVMFLKVIEKSSLRKFRIKQWLLLMLRALIIFFLVFSFSKPVFEGYLAGSDFSSRTKTSAVLLLDNSESMSYTIQKEGHATDFFRESKTALLNVLNFLSETDDIYFFTTSAQETFSPSASKSKLAVKQQVSVAELSESRLSLLDAVNRSLGVLSSSRNFNRELYIASDFQKSQFGLQDSALLKTLIDKHPDVKVFLIPAGQNLSKKNVEVASVEVLTKVIEPSKPVRIRAVLKAFGDEAKNISVKLFLNDKLSGESTTDVSLSGTEVLLTATPLTTGFISAKVQIDDDNLAFDNQYYFSFFIPVKVRLLMVKGDGAETTFFNLALKNVSEQIFFETTEVLEQNAASPDFARFDAVIFFGINQLSAAASSKAITFVKSGGGLLIFPADKKDYTDYNVLLASLGAGRFASSDAVTKASPALIDKLETQHPIFEGIFAQAGRGKADALDLPELYKAAAYTPVAAERSVMSYQGGKRFLSERRLAEGGTVLVFAALPAADWTNFQTKSLFAPLLYRCIFYAASGQGSEQKSFRVGQTGDISMKAAAEKLTIQKPDGKTFFALTKSKGSERLIPLTAAFDKAGIYDIKNGDAVLFKIALNDDPAESDVQSIPISDVKKSLLTLGIDAKNIFSPSTTLTAGTDAVSEMVSGSRYGFGIWKYLVGLAVLLLVVESVLGRKNF